MHLRSVQTQTGSLLELHVAAADLAGVRVELSVRVNVVDQILFLRERSLAQGAGVLFQALMDR